MDKKIAETVLARAKGYCEACGLPGDDFALHHRKLKSRGGKDEAVSYTHLTLPTILRV